MIISLESICKSFGANEVLKDVTCKIEDDNRIGLIGVNGAGKSTLLNIISGNLEADGGIRMAGTAAEIGFLKQNSGLNISNTIMDEMLAVFEKLTAIETEINNLQHKMAQLSHDSHEYKDIAEQYSKLQSVFESNDGYNIKIKINTILNGMGFAEKSKDTIINTLSGGEKTRLAICKLLLQNPNLLILDEPTNHLDFKTLIWLEEYLQGYKGALLIVSHDRYFLDKLVNQIWEIEDKKLKTYAGNYTKYVVLKRERLERQLKEYEMQQQQIAKLEEYVARNIVRATTAKSAKSKRNALERMELIEKPSFYSKTAHFKFNFERDPVKEILNIDNLSLKIFNDNSEYILCSNLKLEVRRGDKIAIVGANGIGKSTFLKTIINGFNNESRNIKWGKNVSISYFEQEANNLNADNTVLEELWRRFPSQYEHYIRTVLGSVLLTGENVYKKVSDISGGEKAKLKFAIMMCEQANVLVFDEPTNHLDLATKDVLDQALSEFAGTIIMVSHDRYLLSKIPNKIVEMTSDGFVEYIGNYEKYIEIKNIKAKKDEKIEKPAAKAASNSSGYRSKKQRSEQVNLKRKIAELETAIEKIEGEIACLEAEISTPDITSDYQLLAKKCEELDDKKNTAAGLYDEWQCLSEELE